MSHYIVGIDLGTSNTVVAYAEPGGAEIRLFGIEQLVAPGQAATRPLLPSVRYHPAPGELAAGAGHLPWQAARPEAGAISGILARDLGARVPGRLVASAKSWLSWAAADRLAPILPWGAPEDVPRVSPVDASAGYLAHVRAAWNRHFPRALLEDQEVALTVPASFDEGARSLTVEAARQAGLPRLRLLEEPQAAFHDWLFRHRDTLAADLAGCRLVLVCDVGGGTTDLTLIRIEAADGPPRLTRIGVGKHLMLGGDNMDLALAHLVEARLEDGGRRLSAARLFQLRERCRAAKELLLADGAPESASVSLPGSGSRLIGGARSTEISREEVRDLLLEGFFPPCAPDARPRRGRAALLEFGLPYAPDAAITRHVAEFLADHAAACRKALGMAEGEAVPDTLLVNGGVFRAPLLAARLADTLAAWRGTPLKVLHNADPDAAVARGAVASLLSRRGLAPRVGGGSARSHFLLLEPDSRQGVCILPRGTEEGREIRLEHHSFMLLTGRPVRFHLYSSGATDDCRAGELRTLSGGDFVSLPPLVAVLPAPASGKPAEIPVQLACELTEVGTLDVHCESRETRWRLEFQLRAPAPPAASARHPRMDEALAAIEKVFGTRCRDAGPRDARQLRRQLEALLGQRDGWDTEVLRTLFDLLWQRAGHRRRSADHERQWLNLAGFCLRPGFGHPLDDWRAAQLWSLYGAGIQYGKESQVGAEWWTLWRRVAGGLDADAQARLFDELAGQISPAPGAGRGAAGENHRGDMVRLVASLERVPAARKSEAGRALLARLNDFTEPPAGWWALGRLGARQPFYGSAHNVVVTGTAEAWLGAVLARDWKAVEPAAFAAAQLARMTGDRARDVAPELRAEVLQRLELAHAPWAWIAMVSGEADTDPAIDQRAFGESLPPGLRLAGRG